MVHYGFDLNKCLVCCRTRAPACVQDCQPNQRDMAASSHGMTNTTMAATISSSGSAATTIGSNNDGTRQSSTIVSTAPSSSTSSSVSIAGVLPLSASYDMHSVPSTSSSSSSTMPAITSGTVYEYQTLLPSARFDAPNDHIRAAWRMEQQPTKRPTTNRKQVHDLH